MTYEMAQSFLQAQGKELRKIRDVRFMHGGYEYKVEYEGGFAAFVGIYRRAVGKRNWKYYKGFGAHDCLSASAALERAKSFI